MKKLLLATVAAMLVTPASAGDLIPSETPKLRAQNESPKIYILASPPTSQVGLVLKGKYYWFSRGEPDDKPCDVTFEGGCYIESNAKFVHVSKDIISINRGKAFGCAPAIIPDTSKVPGFEAGYGKCTSKGWKSIRERDH